MFFLLNYYTIITFKIPSISLIEIKILRKCRAQVPLVFSLLLKLRLRLKLKGDHVDLSTPDFTRIYIIKFVYNF